jgi:hypothetical protein
MKEKASEPDFVKVLQNLRQRLGSSARFSSKGHNLSARSRNYRARLDTTFARGSGREEFVWQLKDNQAIPCSDRIDLGNLSLAIPAAHRVHFFAC